MLNISIKYRYLIGLIIFITLVALKINGSSIGMWENIVTSKAGNFNTANIIGKSRAIRTDEWNVQTPYYLSQAMNNNFYPVVNYDITLSGENMIESYNAPVMDVSILAKPINWGFLLLGKDYGLSWYWSMKIILLILLSFEICMIITNKNKAVSLLGAFWIAFTPAVQWWFMQHVGDLVLYLEAIIVSFYYILKNFNNMKLRILFLLLFSLSSIGFVLVLYPPLQVPMAYLCLAFMILIISDFKDKIKFKFIDILMFIGSIMFIFIVLLHVLMISKDAISSLLNTAYPGKRVSNGGDVPLYYINLFLTNVFLPYKDINFLNDCEASSVFNFLPAIILVMPILLKKHVENLKYGVTFVIFSLLAIYFMIFKINPFIAKVTLLSYVTGIRIMVVYGLTAAYASIWAISVLSMSKYTNKIYAVFCSIFIVATYYFSIIKSPMNKYVSLKYYIMLLIVFFVLNYLLIIGKKILFMPLMFVVILFAGITVNPIVRGTGSIYNNYLSYKIQGIRKEDQSAEWIDANDETGFMGSFLYANGVRTISGTNFYPDIKKWQKLDPSKKYNKIYNRYEHVNFQIYDGKTKFKLIASDSIVVKINAKDLKKYNIKYILTKEDLTKLNFLDSISLKNIYPKDKDGFYIFQVYYK
jgi:hypothetical protein